MVRRLERKGEEGSAGEAQGQMSQVAVWARRRRHGMACMNRHAHTHREAGTQVSVEKGLVAG